jgi:hypothetical protein
MVESRLQAETERRLTLLAPHRGEWVAIEGDWARVAAAAVTREACVALARETHRREATMPLIFRVPGE